MKANEVTLEATPEATPEATAAPEPPPPATRSAAAQPPPFLPPAPGAARREDGPFLHKNPLLAAFLAFFPGLGHIYNGLYRRGMIFFALTAGTLVLVIEAEQPAFVFVMVFLWFFNILDAYRQANLINHGYATDLGLSDRPEAWKAGQGTLVAGVVLLAIGVLEMLRHTGFWRWEWLWDNWYAAFILAGIGLIVAARREMGRAESV